MNRPTWVGAISLAIIVLGCAGSSKPASLPSQTFTQSSPEPPPPPPPPPAPADDVQKPKSDVQEIDTTVKVIDPGGKDPRGKTTLLAASRAEKERRATTPRSRIRIDDSNLEAWASKGNVTVAEVKKIDEDAAAAAAYQAEKEDFWRDKALRLRTKWGDLVDEILDLEEKVAELRTQFYSEDDPARRDTQIKPEWDMSLDRLSQARREAARAETAVEDFLEEGRQAGALPGWLREGIDQEPEERPYERERPQPKEYGEPDVSDELSREPEITEEDR